METIVITSGGFDPLHKGHIAYFEAAKELGDRLIVALNSDTWLTKKRGRSFMPWEERAAVIRALRVVDEVLAFDDGDAEGSSIDAIKQIRARYPEAKILFAQGGERTTSVIPEIFHVDQNIGYIFGVGGSEKRNSSSGLLQEWKAPKTGRQWGYYRVLHEHASEVKLKELTVDPGKKLSMQRHKERAEHWFLIDGVATVNTLNDAGDELLLGTYTKFQHIHIEKMQWHQLCNLSDAPLRVVEIQYGTACIEEDIERK